MLFFRNSQLTSPLSSSFEQTFSKPFPWGIKAVLPFCCHLLLTFHKVVLYCIQLISIFPKKLTQANDWTKQGDLLGNG